MYSCNTGKTQKNIMCPYRIIILLLFVSTLPFRVFVIPPAIN